MDEIINDQPGPRYKPTTQRYRAEAFNDPLDPNQQVVISESLPKIQVKLNRETRDARNPQGLKQSIRDKIKI